jgi:hypothetical protein
MPQSLRTGGVIRRDEAPMFGEHLDGCVVPLEFMARLEQPEIDITDAAFEWVAVHGHEHAAIVELVVDTYLASAESVPT